RGGRLTTPEGQEFSRSAPGTEAFKQDFARWSSLKEGIASLLDRYEAGLARQLAEREAAERGTTPLKDEVPDRYSESVIRYSRSLSRRPDTRWLMRFAYSVPLWAWLLGFALIVAVAVGAYRHARGVLTPSRRAVLIGLRILTLSAIAVILLRPVRLEPAPAASGRAVAVVIDDSRSMRLRGAADATTRLDEARQ